MKALNPTYSCCQRCIRENGLGRLARGVISIKGVPLNANLGLVVDSSDSITRLQKNVV